MVTAKAVKRHLDDGNTATKNGSDKRQHGLAICGTSDHDELRIVVKSEVVDGLVLEVARRLVVEFFHA